ncbi:Candidapepsin-7 [Savitreella phatthalungensis]
MLFSLATLASTVVLPTAAQDTATEQFPSIPIERISNPIDLSDAPWAEHTINKRQTSNGSININSGASAYLGNVTLGTPGQSVQLIVDTGSPLLWVNARNITNFTPGSTRISGTSNICQTASCFNPNSSSTLKVNSNSTVFDIAYADGTQAIGRTIVDTGTFQGLTDTSLEFGLVEYIYNPVGGDPLSGIIGLSPPNPIISFTSINAALQSSRSAASQFTPNPILYQLQDAGRISTTAFSIYLDQNGGGELTVGGVDSSRYTGPLSVLSIQQSNNGPSFTVNLNGLGANGQSSTVQQASNLQVVLDSGTTAAYVPATLLDSLAQQIGGVSVSYSSGTTILGVPCSGIGNGQTLDFYFDNNGVVRVPTQLLYTETLPASVSARYGGLSGQATCLLGIFGLSQSSDNIYLLGDSFLRSAYVVYDYPQGQCAVAQAAYSGASSSSNIRQISNSAFGIPGAVYNSSSPGASSSAVVPTLASAIALNSAGNRPRSSTGTGSGIAGGVPVTRTTTTAGTAAATTRSSSGASSTTFGVGAVLKGIAAAAVFQALIAFILL